MKKEISGRSGDFWSLYCSSYLNRLFADLQGCFSAGSKAQEWEKMQFCSTALHLLPFTFCQAPCLLSENWFFTVKNTIKATPEMLWTIFSRQHLVSVEPSCWQMWVTRGRLSCDVYSPALTLAPATGHCYDPTLQWKTLSSKLTLCFSYRHHILLLYFIFTCCQSASSLPALEAIWSSFVSTVWVFPSHQIKPSQRR